MIKVTLNQLLEVRRLSQRELARRAGAHPEVVSRFAREATSGVSYQLLSKICAALDCTPAQLLRYEPEQPSLFDADEDRSSLAGKA